MENLKYQERYFQVIIGSKYRLLEIVTCVPVILLDELFNKWLYSTKEYTELSLTEYIKNNSVYKCYTIDELLN